MMERRDWLCLDGKALEIVKQFDETIELLWKHGWPEELPKEKAASFIGAVKFLVRLEDQDCFTSYHD